MHVDPTRPTWVREQATPSIHRTLACLGLVAMLTGAACTAAQPSGSPTAAASPSSALAATPAPTASPVTSPDPAGWQRSTSPLGYSVALPQTFRLSTRVAETATQGPYDLFIGPEFGLLIGYFAQTAGTTFPPIREDVKIDGVSAQVDAGGINVFARAVSGGKFWMFQAESGDIVDNPASRALFMRLLSTFRFQSPDA